MTFKTALIVVITALTPSLGLAMGCGTDHEEVRACPDGKVWNSGYMLCINQANS